MEYYVAAVDAMNSWGNNTSVGFRKVSSAANLTVANGNFGAQPFDGIMKSASSIYPPTCVSVFVHEVDHALGRAYNDAGSCSTMAVTDSSTGTRFDRCGISSVRPDDIRGINRLY